MNKCFKYVTNDQWKTPRNILSKINGVDSWHLYLKNSKCLMSEIRYDESECLIFKVVK